MKAIVAAAEEEKGHRDGYHGDQEREGKEICECVGENGCLQPATERGRVREICWGKKKSQKY